MTAQRLPPIVDGHCHVGRGDALTGPWDVAHLGEYLRRADAAGIDRTVLFSVFHGDYAKANRAVARVVASHPDRFVGFAFLHPVRDAGRIASMVAEAVHQHGFRGLKVHRHDGRLTPEIAEAARRFGLPVLYDPMGDAAALDLFATEFPDVDFVVPHLGSFADDWPAQRLVVDLLTRHPNLYADTSGVRRFDLLVEVVRRAGPGETDLRIGRAVAPSGSGAGEGSRALPARSRGTGRARRNPARAARAAAHRLACAARRNCSARSLTASTRDAFWRLPPSCATASRIAVSLAMSAISFREAPAASACWIPASSEWPLSQSAPGSPSGRSSSGTSPTVIGPWPTCRWRIRSTRLRSSRTFPG